MKFSPFFIVLFFMAHNSFGQEAGGNIFDTKSLHEIRIMFDNANFWSTLTQNFEESLNGGVAADVTYLGASVNIDGTSIDSVGVRLKGFSSYGFSGDKKSLKLDFNEFVRGRSYDGMKKINLNNGVGDPSLQRDFLAYDMMRKAGVKAPRTAYAKVYLNDEYWGIYVIVEQIDKTFLKNNFASEEGDLYKNIGWTELLWEGDDASDYESSIALRTNKATSDFSDFIEFVDILNNSSDNDFEQAISQVFDVNYFLRALAIDVVTDNWDSYIEHGRNFYLYHEPISDLFYWIPWDYNLSMGGDFFGGSAGDNLPADLGDCETILNGSSPYAADDPYFVATVQAYNYCCTDIWDSDCQALYDNFVSSGVDTLPHDLGTCKSIIDGSSPLSSTDYFFEQVVNRRTSCCTNTWDSECDQILDQIIFGGGGGPNYIDYSFNLSVPNKILIHRILQVPTFYSQYLNYCCQLMENNFVYERLAPIVDTNASIITDAVIQDDKFEFSLEAFYYDISEGSNSNSIPSVKEFINHRIPYLTQNLSTIGADCQNAGSRLNWNDVVINEFVASNDSTSGISDDDDEYDDWIELYNNTNEEIDLSDYYLSDKYDDVKKWSFPSGTKIQAAGYLIVWADDDEGQNGLHTNFKLSKNGEQLVLSHLDETVIDSLTFGEQTTNVSYARIPNGTGGFINQMSTHGYNNEDNSSISEIDRANVTLYPNPVDDVLFIDLKGQITDKELSISIYNSLGQRILSKNYESFATDGINTSAFNSGMYTVEIKTASLRYVRNILVR